MQLIGMLDSPYVRRVAVTLQLLGLPFEHRSLSVFKTFEQFKAINPVVKAPSLVCDDGCVLMDSTLIIDYAECLAAPGRALMPGDVAGRRRALRIIGLALAACEKAVQIIYERQLRPAEKVYQPWIERVSGQLLAACDGLEAELLSLPFAVDAIDQAGVSVAVAWHFIVTMLPDVVGAADLPALRHWSAQAERLPAFMAAPHGDTTFVQSGSV
ncbi:MAG TPA: glutathione S-transferase [Janthinobacterium sp.]|nr:glutathione S-transferase [Janthinobacterium sp.]